jgi:ABC-2 type transport system permease protein
MAGEVIGIGLLGLGQLALVAALTAVLLAAGAFDAPAELGGSIALVVPWFGLRFALYVVAYAAAGALASGQQDADSAGQPVTTILVAAYLASCLAVHRPPAHGTAIHRSARPVRLISNRDGARFCEQCGACGSGA